jgi:pyruvate kinase
VGNVLVTGIGASKGSVCGNVCICKTPDEVAKYFKNGDILVIPETSNELLPYLKAASAIITEKDGVNSHAAIVGMALDKPVIVGAKNATLILKSGTTVTVDGMRGIVYSGKECKIADNS